MNKKTERLDTNHYENCPFMFANLTDEIYKKILKLIRVYNWVPKIAANLYNVDTYGLYKRMAGDGYQKYLSLNYMSRIDANNGRVKQGKVLL